MKLCPFCLRKAQHNLALLISCASILALACFGGWIIQAELYRLIVILLAGAAIYDQYRRYLSHIASRAGADEQEEWEE